MNRRIILKSGLVAASGMGLLPLSLRASNTSPLVLKATLDSLRDGIEPELLEIPEGEIKVRLSANENPYGPSPKSKQAIVSSLDKSFMYPGKAMRQLIEAIAEKEKVSPKQVMLGAGSTEILMAAFLAFSPKGKFIVADPGYISRVKSLDLVKVKLTSDYKHDLEGMAQAVNQESAMVYICNPNNPTGTDLAPKKLKDFCDAISGKVPVMVDEAYIDYTDRPEENTMMDCVREGKNVIVVRTFSKLHGFAGLRVGYCVAQEETIETLKKFHASNSLTMPSLEGAFVSYQDKEFPKMVLRKTQEAKEFLYKTLKEMDYDYVPSKTNFVLFPLRMKGEPFLKAMREKGVSVRRWEFDRQHWCRVSLGKMDDMKRFTQAFKEVVA